MSGTAPFQVWLLDGGEGGHDLLQTLSMRHEDQLN